MTGIGKILRSCIDALHRLIGNSPASRRPPGGNYIPNSDGNGGRVISTGHGGSGS